jgi:hypothetical protein
MPIIIAAIVAGGTFFGWTAVDSGTAEKAVHYWQQPVRRGNRPYFALITSTAKGNVKAGDHHQ